MSDRERRERRSRRREEGYSSESGRVRGPPTAGPPQSGYHSDAYAPLPSSRRQHREYAEPYADYPDQSRRWEAPPPSSRSQRRPRAEDTGAPAYPPPSAGWDNQQYPVKPPQPSRSKSTGRDGRRDELRLSTQLPHKYSNLDGMDRDSYPKPRSFKWIIIGVALVIVAAAAIGVGIVFSMKASSSSSTGASSVSGSNSGSNSGANSGSNSGTNSGSSSGTGTGSTVTADVSLKGSPATGTVVPADGKYWFGLTTNTAIGPLINKFNKNGAGVKPLLTHVYIQMNETTDSARIAEWVLLVISGTPHNGVAMVSLEPMNMGLNVTNSTLLAHAKAMKQLNDWGYRIIVAFGHEMNGGWYPWGRRPATYVKVFRTFAEIIKSTCGPQTVMAWLPTVGTGYPFDQVNLPAKTSADFTALDTNKNGKLDEGDDAYSPFWPGADYVDWVGGTTYYYGPTFPYVNNYLPETTYLPQQLNGATGSTKADDNFYEVYAVKMNKPFIWAESSIYHWPNGTGVDSLAQKQAWWRQNLAKSWLTKYPKIQACAWFEVIKNEEAWAMQLIDFTISSNQTVLDAFLTDMTTGAAAAGIDPTAFEWAS